MGDQQGPELGGETEACMIREEEGGQGGGWGE